MKLQEKHTLSTRTTLLLLRQEKKMPKLFCCSFPTSPQIPTILLKGMRAKDKKNLESYSTEHY